MYEHIETDVERRFMRGVSIRSASDNGVGFTRMLELSERQILLAESNSTMDLFPSQSPPNAPAHEIDLQVTLFRKSTVHVVGHADDRGPKSLRNLLAWIRFPTGSLSGNSR